MRIAKPTGNMHSQDLTANLYFAAAVRLAADHSLTRLVPLDALSEPLSPHDSFSQRILLSLQALGVIEPELSMSNAEDWLMARDWIDLGLESLAWRIRWSPRECRDRHAVASELLRDIEPSEEVLGGLLMIWEDLALAEVAQYVRWTLAKSGYNPDWDQTAIGSIRDALRNFSISQLMYLVTISLRTVSSTHQQGGIPSERLGRVFADAIGSFARRAVAERWIIRGMARPNELRVSTIAAMFAHDVTRLDDAYLTRTPSIVDLYDAMTRARSIH